MGRASEQLLTIHLQSSWLPAPRSWAYASLSNGVSHAPLAAWISLYSFSLFCGPWASPWPCLGLLLNEWMNEWMNEKFILFSCSTIIISKAPFEYLRETFKDTAFRASQYKMLHKLIYTKKLLHICRLVDTNLCERCIIWFMKLTSSWFMKLTFVLFMKLASVWFMKLTSNLVSWYPVSLFGILTEGTCWKPVLSPLSLCLAYLCGSSISPNVKNLSKLYGGYLINQTCRDAPMCMVNTCYQFL